MTVDTRNNISPGVIVLTLAVLMIILMVGVHMMSRVDTRTSDTALAMGNMFDGYDHTDRSTQQMGDAVEETGGNTRQTTSNR